MKLSLNGIKEQEAWEKAGITLPGYDVEAVSEKAKKEPGWVHFGIGNIFRVFIGGIADGLLEEGVADQGDHVGVELLDVSSVPDRSGGVSQDGEQVSAAVDDLRVNSSKVCRHHHNELLPSNE